MFKMLAQEDKQMSMADQIAALQADIAKELCHSKYRQGKTGSYVHSFTAFMDCLNGLRH